MTQQLAHAKDEFDTNNSSQDKQLPQRVMTKQGVEAWLIEDSNVPVVSFRMRIAHAGSAQDPKDKSGLANLATSLLDEGACDFDATEFQTMLEEKAIELRFWVDDDAIYASVKSLAEYKEFAIYAMFLALTEARFDPDAIARVKGQMVASMKRRSKNPSSVASDKIREIIFKPSDHPYQNVTIGNEEGLSNISREDLKAFMNSVLGQDRLIISAAGDIAADELKEILEKYLEEIPEKAQIAAINQNFDWKKDPKNIDNESEITEVAMPISQSVVRLVMPGINRDHENFYELFVLNHIIGGSGLTSKLMDEVREKRGLTYGIYSHLDIDDHANGWAISLSTRPENVDEAIKITKSIFADIKKNGVSEEELADAKSYLIGSFPLNLDNNSKIASILEMMQKDNLGIDYLVSRNKYIKEVTLDDINAAAAKLIIDNDIIGVVVTPEESDDN